MRLSYFSGHCSEVSEEKFKLMDGAVIDQLVSQLWDMPASLISLSFGLLVYPAVSFLLAIEFPPFYVRVIEIKLENFLFLSKVEMKEEDFIKAWAFCTPFIVGLIIVIVTTWITGMRGPLVIVGSGALIAGLRIRRFISKNTDGPLGYYLTCISKGRPMLVFDIWTIAWTVAFCSLVVFN